MMSGFKPREDSNSFLICQRSRPLAAMFLRDQVCFICFVVGHRGNIPANFYSVLTIGSRGYVNISYKCLQRKPATPCVIFLQKCTMTAAILNFKVVNCFHVKPAKLDIISQYFFFKASGSVCLKALSHYNVLSNVYRRMEYISSMLAYADL